MVGASGRHIDRQVSCVQASDAAGFETTGKADPSCLGGYLKPCSHSSVRTFQLESVFLQIMRARTSAAP